MQCGFLIQLCTFIYELCIFKTVAALPVVSGIGDSSQSLAASRMNIVTVRNWSKSKCTHALRNEFGLSSMHDLFLSNEVAEGAFSAGLLVQIR